MQVYLHIIYIHIYIQVAHNFDTFYATKLKFGVIYTQTKTDFMVELPLGLATELGQGSECITGHIEYIQNGSRIISLVPLLALESSCSHGTCAIIQTHKSINKRGIKNVQTNRHGSKNKGCNQASVDSKHYLVSKLRPPCP